VPAERPLQERGPDPEGGGPEGEAGGARARLQGGYHAAAVLPGRGGLPGERQVPGLHLLRPGCREPGPVLPRW